MHFMKAIQVFSDKASGEVGNGPGSRHCGRQMPLLSGSPFVTAQLFRGARGPRRRGVPTGMGHSHTINILLLFIGHLGSRKTGLAQRFTGDSKAPLFLGLV